jgi:hypothetical protein
MGWKHFASVAVCVCLSLFLFLRLGASLQDFHRSGFIGRNDGLSKAIHVHKHGWNETASRTGLIFKAQHLTVIPAELVAILVVPINVKVALCSYDLIPFLFGRHLFSRQILGVDRFSGDVSTAATGGDTPKRSFSDSLIMLNMVPVESASGFTYTSSREISMEIVGWSLTSVKKRNGDARFLSLRVSDQVKGIVMFSLHTHIGAQFNRSIFPRSTISLYCRTRGTRSGPRSLFHLLQLPRSDRRVSDYGYNTENFNDDCCSIFSAEIEPPMTQPIEPSLYHRLKISAGVLAIFAGMLAIAAVFIGLVAAIESLKSLIVFVLGAALLIWGFGLFFTSVAG